MAKDATRRGDVPLPAEALPELVAQYHHRLLSLEADLKDQAKTGAVSSRAFARRVERLEALQRLLTGLRSSCVAESPGRHAGKDVGLPVLSDCTPAEVAVCERFLKERDDAISRAEKEAGRVYRWLLAAVAGQTGPIRMTLRLSALRRLLQGAERDAELLEEATKTAAQRTEKLLASGAREGAARRDGGTLEGLMTLFHQLDGTIGRVAKLRVMVRQEREKTRAMDAWLRHEVTKIRARRAPQPPPSPIAIAKAEAAALGPLPTFRRNVQRQRVAEEYWQDVVHNGTRLPTEKEIRRAATVFRTVRPKEAP